MHGNEDAVDPHESYPEMKLAEPFTHETAKHLREPEVNCGKHTEDRSHAHHEVEVGRHKISIMHGQIKRRLAQHQACNSAGNKNRDEPNGKKHRGSEANFCAP